MTLVAAPGGISSHGIAQRYGLYSAACRVGARFNALHSVTLPCFGQSRAVAGIVPLHITLMRFMLVHHPPRFMSAFRDSPGLLFPIIGRFTGHIQRSRHYIRYRPDHVMRRYAQGSMSSPPQAMSIVTASPSQPRCRHGRATKRTVAGESRATCINCPIIA